MQIFGKTNIPNPHVSVRIRRLEMLVFRKILRMYLMDDPLMICGFVSDEPFKFRASMLDNLSSLNC